MVVMFGVGQVRRFSVRFSLECCVPLFLILVKTKQEVLLYLPQRSERETVKILPYLFDLFTEILTENL